MKKALFLLSLLAFLLLAACGRAAPAETPAAAETPAPAETAGPGEVTPSPDPEADPYAPPVLTLVSGDGETQALLKSASWKYLTAQGEEIPFEQADLIQARYFYEADWYSLGAPVHYADGEVLLRFGGREPEGTVFYAFTALGMVPVELRDGRFTPFAGLNTYALICDWNWVKEGGSGTCMYILFIQGAETNAPTVAETEEMRLTVTRADGYGCAVTLEDLGSRPFNPVAMDDSGNPYALLRRTAAGGWEWVQPIRHFQGFAIPSLDKGESRTWAWDWSYSNGVLPAGDYALMLRGTLGRGTAKEPVYLRGEFTIAEAEPQAPGPLAFCSMPEGMENTLEKRSDHRWLQTLSTEDRGWVVETDYALFRVTRPGEEDEEWEYIPPEYHIPEWQNYPAWLLYGGTSRAYDVDLAAQYGELPAGTYVLRRRFLRLTEEGIESVNYQAYRNWRLVPEDRIVYGDSWFTLRYALWDVPRGMDPMDERVPPYNGEDSSLLVSTAGSEFTSSVGTVQLESLYTDPGLSLSVEADYYYLYFSYLGEWYPVEHKRLSSHGLIGSTLAPGETKKLVFPFEAWYGELAPGTYRLLISCWSEPFGEDAGFILCEFHINADGSGEWQGLEEAENLVNVYSAQLAARYRYDVDGDWFYSPGPFWSRDPYVSTWKLERQAGKLTVTVYRDGDYTRAQALLGNNPQVEILRKELITTHSPVTEDNTRRDGVLTARIIEQEDPALEPQGTWLLSLTWNGEEPLELEPDAFLTVFVEEYDPEGDEWRRLPHNWGQIGPQWMTFVPLEPGKTVNVYNVSLGWYMAELSRDKQYRFALLTDTQAGVGETLEYFLCPFRLGQGTEMEEIER